MLNALTASGSSLLQTNTTSALVYRVADRLFTEMRAKTDRLDASYQSQFDSLNARKGLLAGVLGEAADIMTGVENGKQQVKDIKTLVMEMRTILSNARQYPSQNKYFAKQFNAKVDEINKIADRHSEDENLLGNVDPATLLPAEKSVRKGVFGGDLEIQGMYVGASFNIIGTGDDAGTAYENKPGLGFMKLVNKPGGEELTGSAMHNGWNISNVVVGADDSIQFDYNSDQFTGTLEKGGLGLMPAWFYDDLSSEEGVAAASEALTAAESYLREVSFNLQSISIEIKPVLNKIEEQHKGIREQITEMLKQKASETREIEGAATREFNAVEASLENASSNLANHKKLLGSLAQGSFVNILT